MRAIPAIRTKDLRLIACSAPFARALDDDRSLAAKLSGLALHADWPDEELPLTLESYAKLIEAYPDKIGWGVWLFCREGMVIGDGGFHGPPKDGRVQIGYSIVPDHRKRGYATQAVRALCGWATGQGAKSILAHSDPGNKASARVLEKCGFIEMPIQPTGDGSITARKWLFSCT